MRAFILLKRKNNLTAAECYAKIFCIRSALHFNSKDWKLSPSFINFQIKKLILKVVQRDNFRYRKFTDCAVDKDGNPIKSEEEGVEAEEEDSEDEGVENCKEVRMRDVEDKDEADPERGRRRLPEPPKIQ